jgi:hypothetical protein
MSNVFGKLLTALQNYKFNFTFNQDARPIEGFIRWLTGMGKRAFFGKRREPSLDAFIRHSAAVFMWQAVVYGALIAASDSTGLNFLASGVPLWVGLLLLLDKLLRPASEKAKQHWRMAQWGIVSPLAGVFGDMMVGFGFIFGGNNGVLDMARLQMPVPLVEAKRIVEENPEVFDRPGADLIYNVLGQKTALYGMSAAARLRHHSGLMSPTERDQYRHLITRRRPKHKDSISAPSPFAPSTGSEAFPPIGLGGSL